jgi:aldehyde:ferredoxin oxidoreductase
LKYSGYDNLIITGRSDKPVYLKVFDDDVEIRDASHLWRKDTWQTIDLIHEELGPCSVSCIGLAGENLVRFASIRSNKRSGANKTGLGAVMGSKNLKAIAARGSKGIQVASRSRFRRLVNRILANLTASPTTMSWRQYGSASGWPSDREGFRLDEYREKMWKRPYACHACPVACKAVINLADGASLPISALPSLVGHHQMARVEDWEELGRCVELENRYGVDGAAMAGIVNLLCRLQEEGIIARSDLNGLDINWGGESIRRLIPVIVNKEGIGALLAGGARDAAKKIGRGADKFANHVKGVQKEPGIGSTFSSGEFNRATNPRGGHGERAGTLTAKAQTDPAAFREYCHSIGIPEEALERVCSGPHGYNVARLTKWAEDFNSVLFSTGICVRNPFKEHMDLETLAELYEVATGIQMSADALLRAGERIWNLQKLFNIRCGWTRKDDLPNTMPPDEPIIAGGKSYGTFNQLLDEYYEERGWNVRTGIPQAEKSTELGIDNHDR